MEWSLVIVCVAIFIIMKIRQREFYCMDCGYRGRAKNYTKGSLALEILLWLFFIVPGLIYSFWRLTSGKYTGCPVCRSEKIISIKRYLENKERIDKRKAA